MNVCVYPGSFDPFTLGHLDVLKNASEIFDRVYVAVLKNSSKVSTFTVEERMDMITKAAEECSFSNVIIDQFEGLTVDYLKKVDAHFVIRGLRAITDFEYEFQMNAMNRHLYPDMQTVCFMSSTEHSYLSSSIVKELCQLNGDISDLVPTCNIEFITERLSKHE